MLQELADKLKKGATVSQLRDEYVLSNSPLLRKLEEAKEKGLLTKKDLDMLQTDRTMYDFPNNPELRLEAVLSCMNSELKQGVLLVLGDEPKKTSDIRSRLVELTGLELPKKTTFLDYFTKTISPIGFFVERRIRKKGGFICAYFSLSEAGKKYGQPIAAFSLDYPVENDVSFYTLLGGTSSSGDSRSPYNRARMIELLREGCRTEIELERELGLSHPVVNRHLKHLQKLRLLKFSSRNYEADQQGIKFSSNDKSIITIDEEPSFFEKYIRAVRGALDDRFEVEDMKTIQQEFMQSKGRFSKHLRKRIEIYLTISPAKKAKPALERETELLRFVERYQKKHGIGPRPIEVEKEKGWGRNMVDVYFRSLFKKGRLERNKEGRAVRYSLKK